MSAPGNFTLPEIPLFNDSVVVANQYHDVGTEGIIAVATYNTALFVAATMLFVTYKVAAGSWRTFMARDKLAEHLDQRRGQVNPAIDWPAWLRRDTTVPAWDRLARFFRIWRLAPSMQRVVGLDAWLYLQFQAEIILMLAILATTGMGSIFFVNKMRVTEDCEDAFCQTTIKNIGDDERVLWVHLAYTYFASLIVAYFVYRMHTRLLHGRAFAARSMLSAHTALIQDGVPPDADADDIEAFLAQGYPKGVVRVVTVIDLTRLQTLAERRRSLERALDRARVLHTLQRGMDPNAKAVVVERDDMLGHGPTHAAAAASYPRAPAPRYGSAAGLDSPSAQEAGVGTFGGPASLQGSSPRGSPYSAAALQFGRSAAAERGPRPFGAGVPTEATSGAASAGAGSRPRRDAGDSEVAAQGALRAATNVVHGALDAAAHAMTAAASTIRSTAPGEAYERVDGEEEEDGGEGATASLLHTTAHAAAAGPDSSPVGPTAGERSFTQWHAPVVLDEEEEGSAGRLSPSSDGPSISSHGSRRRHGSRAWSEGSSVGGAESLPPPPGEEALADDVFAAPMPRAETDLREEAGMGAETSRHAPSLPFTLVLCPGGSCCPNPLHIARCSCLRSRRNEVAALSAELAEAREEEAAAVRSLLAEARLRPVHCGKAFVVFTDPMYAEQFVERDARLSMLRSHTTGAEYDRLGVEKWSVVAAPEPSDINWRWLSARRTTRWIIFALFTMLLVSLMFVLTSPAALLSILNKAPQGRAAEANVAHVLDAALQQVGRTSPQLADLVFAYLPSLLLVVVNAVLLYILYLVGHAEPHTTFSSRESSIMRTSFFYLAFNTMLVPTLLLTSMSAVFDFIVHTDIRDVGKRLFLQSSGAFFVNYVLQRALLTTMVDLWRLAELAYAWWLRSRAVTARERLNAAAAWDFEFGQQYAMQLSVLLLALTFCTMVPILVPVTLLYFIVKHLVDKYNLLFICPRTGVSRGYITRTALRFVPVCLVVHQSAMLVFFLSRGSPTMLSGCAALLVVTLLIAARWYLVDVAREEKRMDGGDFFKCMFGVSASQGAQWSGYDSDTEGFRSTPPPQEGAAMPGAEQSVDTEERVRLQPGGAQALNCDRYINPQWASLMSNLEAAAEGPDEEEGKDEEADEDGGAGSRQRVPSGGNDFVDDVPAGLTYS